MKRAHLLALTDALGGQSHLVASLHVLSQPTLDADDHAFLIHTSSSLHSIDLLRWLARCPADGPRAHIIGRLAEDARRKPARFEAEVLGARLDALGDEDWAELFEQLAATAAPSLVQRLLSRTSGCAVYRALVAARQERPADPCRHPHAVDPFAAFEPHRSSPEERPALELARALFPVRHDERACLVALRMVLATPDSSPLRLLAAADAGVLHRVEAPLALFPSQTRFSWEHAEDEASARVDAALRSVAAHLLGDDGVAWLASQVDAALGRGVPFGAILGELCPDALRALWPRSSRLPAALLDASRGATPEKLRALRRLLPQDIADDELARLLPSASAGEASLMSAVLERASRTSDGSECAELLGWLERHEAPRHALFEVASGAFRRGVTGGDLLAWIASQLASRSAWERYGTGVLVAMLERGAWSEMAELFAQCWSAAGGGDRTPLLDDQPGGPAGASSPAGFREAVHGAFAQALLQLTRAAVSAGQEAAALRALSALACLDPPSRLNSALHDLARRPETPPAVAELLAVNASLVKHGNGREATLQGVIAAVHVLSSRLPRGGASMSFVNVLTRELFLKVVYCGPGMCGKTANVQYIHTTADPTRVGKLISLNTESERTLFFDFMPVTLGEVAGYTTRLQIYTVPGQIFYHASRRLILRGLDGLVFVADSQEQRREANLESLEDIQEILESQGTPLPEIPHVFQLNKRDLPGVMPTEEMLLQLGLGGATVIEAVASRGEGVFDTLKAVTRLVLAQQKAPRSPRRRATG